MGLAKTIARTIKKTRQKIEGLILASYLTIYFLPPKDLSELIKASSQPNSNSSYPFLEFAFHFGYSSLFYFILLQKAKVKNIKKSLIVIFGLSTLLELLQPLVGRDFEIKDILLDSLGGVVSIVALKLLDLLNSQKLKYRFVNVLKGE